jgi:hypothetical protein
MSPGGGRGFFIGMAPANFDGSTASARYFYHYSPRSRPTDHQRDMLARNHEADSGACQPCLPRWNGA